MESDRCKDDYAGEEARRKRVMEEVAKVEVEEGGSTKVPSPFILNPLSETQTKVLFTENGSDCLYLLTSLLGKVVVVQMASACRVEVSGLSTSEAEEGKCITRKQIITLKNHLKIEPD